MWSLIEVKPTCLFLCSVINSLLLQETSLSMCFSRLFRSSDEEQTRVSPVHAPFHASSFYFYTTIRRFNVAPPSSLVLLLLCGWTVDIGSVQVQNDLPSPIYISGTCSIPPASSCKRGNNEPQGFSDLPTRTRLHTRWLQDSKCWFTSKREYAENERKERERLTTPSHSNTHRHAHTHTLSHKYTEAAALTYGVIMNSRARAVTVLNVTFAHKSIYYFLQHANSLTSHCL